MKNKVKLLALYLPQFHEIEENNKWWGEGFTEWTNVKRGRKLYINHDQPKIPFNKNYYDLNDPTVMHRQVEMAKKAHIYGFCFYHYYFTGKKLLEKPVENYRNYEERIPYCLAWANQSWSRTWYGKNGKNEILLSQSYGGVKEWTEHFQYLLPFFKDERYIKIKGYPVFLIYLAQDFHECSKMISLWNTLAEAEGIPGIYFIAMDTGFNVKWFPRKISATVDFEPMRSLRDIPDCVNRIRTKRRRKFLRNGISKSIIKNSLMVDNVLTYRLIGKLIEKRTYNLCNVDKNYLGVFTGWDNTARKDESGFVIRNSNPKKFEKLLMKQMKKSIEMGNEFLFINAWNEWSEGAYLEPDEKYGYGYLNAVKRAVEKIYPKSIRFWE